MNYVFAIIFRMLIGILPGKMYLYYGTIRRSMSTLFNQALLGDELAAAWNDMWDVIEENPDEAFRIYCGLSLFALYVFLAQFTTMNMLIGVLVNVILGVQSGAYDPWGEGYVDIGKLWTARSRPLICRN